MSDDRPRLGRDFDDAEIALEIQPDGTVRFEVGGVPGQGCRELEKLLVAALNSPVLASERTPEFYARRKLSLQAGLQALLGKK